VCGDDADVVPLACRVVLAGLTGGSDAGLHLGEPVVRVGRAGVPEPDTVGNRDLDLGAPRVEGADDADHALLTHVAARVAGALRRIPLACLRGRVVAGLVADRVLAGLVAL